MGVVGFFAGVAMLAVGFGLVERRWPAVSTRRTAWRLDLTWLVANRLLDPVVKAALGLAIALPLLASGLPRDRAVLLAGHGPLAALPGWVQLPLVLFLADGIGAAVHAWHHRDRQLWRVHAVHHSSTHLDWLAEVRVHPINELLNRAPGALALLLLGFDLRYVAAAAPILGLWAIGVHANVDWRLGPLRYVLATPAFHRWHHAQPPPGHPHGCNFAGLFPVWDLLFGTFHLPPEPATAFGVTDLEVPETFLGQLLLRIRAR